MSKLSKKQRREKRKKKGPSKKRQIPTRNTQEPWVAPKMKLFQLPSIFPDNIPREERIKVVRSIGAKAKEFFDEQYPKISSWFEKYDALYLLSFISFYLLSQQEGIDKEAIGELDFPHHYLEIMQAFALTQQRSLNIKPLMDDARKLKQDMQQIGEAMNLRMLSFPEEVATDEELNTYHLRTQMMMQTTAVRNWAYPHQMSRLLFDLAGAVEQPFTEIYGISPTVFFECLLNLTDERNDLLNAHLEKVRSFVRKKDYRKIINAYNDAFPENVPIEEGEIEEVWKISGKKRKSLIAMMVAHSDLKLENIYTFNIDKVCESLGEKVDRDVIETLLDRLSFNFGDLSDFNIEYMVLGNPIWNKPFIKLQDGNYFSAIWGIMPHVALDILESLIWDDQKLRHTYTQAKANYLENEVERVIRAGFPNASVFRGSVWEDKQSGKIFENDILVLIDNFALVVEAKSGGVSDPARRGAPKRLFETLSELIEEPSEQALRFIEYLEGNQKIHEFKNKSGEIKSIDSRKIKYYIPIGITLSQLGFIGSNIKQLIEAKITKKSIKELAPSICLTDLEIIFHLLPSEIEKIHYLARRREFEAHMNYEADELDLLAFYLDNGFNIGEAEYSNDSVLNLCLKSKELDPYLVGTNEGKDIIKPKLSKSEWWNDILLRISEVRTEGWVETGFILLNSTKEDQEEFESMFKELMEQVKCGQVKEPHNWLVFTSGPNRRRYIIVGYPFTTTDRHLRDDILNEILSDDSCNLARGCVVLGVQTDRLDYPYSIMARRAATNLFDNLGLDEIG